MMVSSLKSVLLRTRKCKLLPRKRTETQAGAKYKLNASRPLFLCYAWCFPMLWENCKCRRGASCAEQTESMAPEGKTGALHFTSLCDSNTGAFRQSGILCYTWKSWYQLVLLRRLPMPRRWRFRQQQVRRCDGIYAARCEWHQSGEERENAQRVVSILHRQSRVFGTKWFFPSYTTYSSRLICELGYWGSAVGLFGIKVDFLLSLYTVVASAVWEMYLKAACNTELGYWRPWCGQQWHIHLELRGYLFKGWSTVNGIVLLNALKAIPYVGACIWSKLQLASHFGVLGTGCLYGKGRTTRESCIQFVTHGCTQLLKSKRRATASREMLYCSFHRFTSLHKFTSEE